MDVAPHVKRARQACEPCRRKKSRCPGEKPTCSYCRRLGQRCFYKTLGEGTAERSQVRRNAGLEQRMGSLESKMDRLIQQFGYTETSIPQQDIGSLQPRLPDTTATMEAETLDTSRLANLQRTGELYLTWCHNQPVGLFAPETFVSSLPQRQEPLVLSLMALALRFPPETRMPAKDVELAEFAKSAQDSTLKSIGDGTVELHTLQTLCVLSLYHFGIGSASKASFYLGTARHLGRNIICGDTGATGELGHCLRSIEVLQRLHGDIVAGNGAALSACDVSRIGYDGLTGNLFNESAVDHSIASCAFTFCEAWQMARSYAAARVGPDALPPWDSRSDYSAVMQSHLRIDCRLPLKYRFASNRIADKGIQELQSNRAYWGPFLFLQVAYAAIPCIVNHPFLLSMRLRSFRYVLPQSFVQQSFEHITRHAGWIMYFLKLIEDKGFQVSDPSVAHCVAVVATIHLQHSFSRDLRLREKAQGGFDTCLKFLRGMGGYWPCVSNMASNLVRLHQSVTQVLSPGEVKDEPALSIDARLLWDILIYERAVRPNAEVDQSMLGDTLRWETPLRSHYEGEEGSAEFDLMGSAGISRHKLVPREIPIYAPGENATQLTVQDEDEEEESGRKLGTNNRDRDRDDDEEENMPDAGLSLEDVYYEGVGGPVDQETLFLQANDYGRSIENWFSFDEAI